MMETEKMPLLTRLVDVFLRGDVAILLILVSIAAGVAALLLTPREEEPQIVVPMADVFVSAPGLSAAEVEQQVTTRLEKLLYQIDGVEYVYSMSRPGESIVTVRFYVGEDREDSLVKLHNKLDSNRDRVPPAVTDWVVKPLEVDDVPIVVLTFWSRQVQRYGDHQLRRLAEQIQNELQAVPDTNRVAVVGGRPRRIHVRLDPARLASRQTAALQVVEALRLSNVNRSAGRFDQRNEEFVVEAGTFFRDVEQLRDTVVNIVSGTPVYLKDVATVTDGPAEVERYSWIGFGAAEHAGDQNSAEVYPAVHISVGKRKGSNAVAVSRAVQRRMADLARTHLPDGVEYRVTRDYGQTADDKVNELVEGLAIAVLTVIGLIGLSLGWRPALVVALAVPVCYSLTLLVNLLVGYTINRVTMFALILSLGLLVDDPITDVENITRYFGMRKLPARKATLRAIQEVRPALILSTLAIIASFVPLAFITGMMGPYMSPMALNVPLTVSISTLVAFVITPWLAMIALSGKTISDEASNEYDPTRALTYRFYNRLLRPLLVDKVRSWGVLAGVAVLLAAAMALPALRVIPLKMLPYDNKDEFQVLLDMPEGTTLDRTDAVARELARYVAGLAEVTDYQVYVGVPSPMDFNGMVRHYFLRRGAHLADIRVNLVGKEHRVQQSHEIVLRIRDELTALAARHDGEIKLVEVPPGPPVISTITAEVYGPHDAPYARMIDVARRVRRRLAREPDIVDVDDSSAADQTRWVFVTDKNKAALSGISTRQIADTLKLSVAGQVATMLHSPTEVDPLPVELRLPRIRRSAIDDLRELYVMNEQGQAVQLGELGRFERRQVDQTIYHKNLRRVVYVTGEVAGRPPADAIVDMQLDRRTEPVAETTNRTSRPLAERTWVAPGGGDPWYVPAGYSVVWTGEGEWKITLDVFRDLGIAFAAALAAIFVILMFQTGSRVLPVVIMLAIPLTLIGIMPGFWILNAVTNRPVGGYANPVFFTATAMIGMIALAGIVVRNSVVLIDFIQYALAEGHTLAEAIVRSAAVRTRPILLTAGTTLLGNWVITLDPVFSGLAWAIIFGILTSTLFTLVVIPVVYWLLSSSSRAGEPKTDGS